LAIEPRQSTEKVMGVYGLYQIETSAGAVSERTLNPGEQTETLLIFTASQAGKLETPIDGDAEYQARLRFLQEVERTLQLETPDPLLNQAFVFAKIRTSESLYLTKMGLVHSPGGGNYYGGIWNNDQIEYSAPFFPYLGYAPALEATENALRQFRADMKPDYSPIWSSHEMEGDLTCCGKDRGDAAMYAYGALRYLLEKGDRKTAEEFWPAIAWCLEYCERKKTAEGVIASTTDEMEGRIPTGTANLATSCLAYDALRSATLLANDLGRGASATLYATRAGQLREAIEHYFGAEVEGLHTYRYFAGHEGFRHWICLPVLMGIEERKQDTLVALFEKLWTPLGLRVQSNLDVWWDRGTLYALNGALRVGDRERGLKYLNEYTRSRLLGNHVPYPMEAWPENDQAHLAAESALYCRIFTEGLFGVQPAGLQAFQFKPLLASGWPKMSLRALHYGGKSFDLEVEQAGDLLQVTVLCQGQLLQKKQIRQGESLVVEW
jgi:hypothetical protein